jgi:hypothetical protein
MGEQGFLASCVSGACTQSAALARLEHLTERR